MMRRKRCVECGTKFYAPHDAETPRCQNCTGETVDNVKQAQAEAALIKKANSAPKDREQIVNPRTGKTPKEETKNVPQAQQFPR